MDTIEKRWPFSVSVCSGVIRLLNKGRKIGVATVYQSYNCGSFLQAYAMQKTLESYGCEIHFLTNKRTRRSRLWYRLLQAVKYLCVGKKKRAIHLLKVYANFKKAQTVFSIQQNTDGLDAVVYGSDTIWDVDVGYFSANWYRFFGADFNGEKIAYAVSVGGATVSSIVDRKPLRDAIASFDKLAVRDEATYTTVKACCGEERSVEMVVDPTMLLSAQEYQALAPQTNEKGYIFFYYFSAIPDRIKEQVRAFAQATRRKIIAFGEDVGWADKYVSNDPFLMLSYYKNADLIITNTFHGNVFSIIFNKPFISFGKEKQKVQDLLKRFDLSHRLVDASDEWESLLEEPIDFTEINAKVAVLRSQSLHYLQSSIIGEKGISSDE